MFKDQKYRVFQKINFNKKKIWLVGSPKHNVGILGLKFESPKNNEFIEKVLNGKIKLEEEEEEENKENVKKDKES